MHMKLLLLYCSTKRACPKTSFLVFFLYVSLPLHLTLRRIKIPLYTVKYFVCPGLNKNAIKYIRSNPLSYPKKKILIVFFSLSPTII